MKAQRYAVIGVFLIFVTLGLSLGVGLGVGLRSKKKVTSSATDHQSSKKMWLPAIGSTWDYHLQNTVKQINKKTDIYDIDLFDNSAKEIESLHDNKKKVICYFSAGSYEDWRSDSKLFKKSDLGKPLDGWKGERWVNISSSNVRDIMRKRIKMAHDKKCDAIDPDNIDGYDNKNGLGLTKHDSIDFIKYLSKVTHSYNMSIGLKNSDSIIKKVINDVDFSVQEQCVQYDNCKDYQEFIKNEKCVFHVEYPKGEKNNNKNVSASTVKRICSNKSSKGFSTILKNLDLDNWIQFC